MTILEENENFKFWEEEGIICFIYKKKHITLDMAKMGVDIRLRVTGAKPCLMYVDLSHVHSLTKESRDYYATYEAGNLLIATAVYTPSQLTKTLCTFFMNFNKPALPFQFFCKKEKAFRWLHKFEMAENLNLKVV